MFNDMAQKQTKRKMTKKERENIAFLLKLIACCLAVVALLFGCYSLSLLLTGAADDSSVNLPGIATLLAITGFFIALIDRDEFHSSLVIIIALLGVTIFCACVFGASLATSHAKDAHEKEKAALSYFAE